jgi:hypothetical protein
VERLIGGLLAVFALGACRVGHGPNDAPTRLDAITYWRDARSGQCFAFDQTIRGHAQGEWMGTVPCDAVLAQLKDMTAVEHP